MSDDFQWGGGVWSEVGWADSDSAFSHVIRAVAGINSQASATRLTGRHVATASATIQSGAIGIGSGPAAIHPVRGSGEIDAATSSASLTFSHLPTATATIDADVPAASLTMSHETAAAATIVSLSTGWLALPHHVTASAAIVSPASAAALTLSHTLTALAAIVSVASAADIASVPVVDPPELLNPANPSAVLHGIVNLVRNPSVEVSLEGWDAYGGATISRDDDHAWHGTQSTLVTIPTADPNQGVAIRTAQALRIMPWGGSVLWGQAYVATEDAGVAIAAWIRVHYTDGTTVDDPEATGYAVTASGVDADWQPVLTPPFDLDDTKRINYAALMVQAVFFESAPASFWVDGAQIELDVMMHGPSTVTVDDVVVAEAA